MRAEKYSIAHARRQVFLKPKLNIFAKFIGYLASLSFLGLIL